MKICIIGGGAAGLMAAAAAVEANPDVEVVLLEKNESLGKKVIISGGGRCNLTTGIQDVKVVLTNYPRGSQFLTKAMHRFSPRMVYHWFESHGVPLKIEADMRVFPKSDDGRDVVRVFETIFTKSKVRVMFGVQVQGIKERHGVFTIRLKGQNASLLANKVILTTGGQTYRQTGSTGDGYAFASSLGHSITRLVPSLCALFTQETWPAKVAGISFPQVDVGRSSRGGRQRTSGPLLFTHKGISGPAVFAFSSLVAFEELDAEHPMVIAIDLFPERTEEDLVASLKTQIADTPKKSFVNVLAGFVPKSLAQVVTKELSLDGEKRANEISKKDLVRCAAWLKGLPLHVISRSGGDEFVTAGGVRLKNIDPSTLESKIHPGLYFAGEILDIDGFTGGFNLQSAWATGRLAGSSAGKATR